MLNAAPLSLIEEAGIAVLTLTEGLEAEEFLASRLTRAETRRQLRIITETGAGLPPHVHSLLAEVDWDGWQSVAQRIDAGGEAEAEALWFAVRALTPAVLMWLRVYRKDHPEIFAYRPPASGRTDA